MVDGPVCLLLKPKPLSLKAEITFTQKHSAVSEWIARNFARLFPGFIERPPKALWASQKHSSNGTKTWT